MTAETATSLKIPGYSVIRALASGGMAEVYLATQENFGRTVALKIMTVQGADPTFGERFMREARIVAQMSHSNIVSVFDVGEIAGKHYLSMEYLEGGDLQERLKRNADPVFALDVCRAIASALKYAHDKGFVHRDIKPANVLFRGDGTPVLTDFGIARAVGSNTMLTQQGLVVGTPAYMSPEQALGKPVDNRSDIYSLGILFYQLITGDVPYKSESVISVIMKHVQEPIPRLDSHDKRLQPLIDKMMAKEPAARYQDCAQVIAALDRLRNVSLQAGNADAAPSHDLATESLKATSVNPRPATNPVALATALGIAAAVLLAIMAWYTLKPTGSSSISSDADSAPQPVAEKPMIPPDTPVLPENTSKVNAMMPTSQTVSDKKAATSKPAARKPAPAPAWPLSETSTQRKTPLAGSPQAKKSDAGTTLKTVKPAPPPTWPLPQPAAQTKPASAATATSKPAAAPTTSQSNKPVPPPAWPLSAKPAD